MAHDSNEVLPTIDVKTHLNTYLKQVREQGVDSEPVYFGAHRKREAVIISAARFEEMLATIESQGYKLIDLDPDYNTDRNYRRHNRVFEEGLKYSTAQDDATLSPHMRISGPGASGKTVMPTDTSDADVKLAWEAEHGKLPTSAPGDIQAAWLVDNGINVLTGEDVALLLRVIEDWEGGDFTRDLQVRTPLWELTKRLNGQAARDNPIVKALDGLIAAINRGERPGVLVDFDALDAAVTDYDDQQILTSPELAESLAQMQRGEGRVLAPLPADGEDLTERNPAADALMADLANGDCGSTTSNPNGIYTHLTAAEQQTAADLYDDTKADQEVTDAHFAVAARLQSLRAQTRQRMGGQPVTAAEVLAIIAQANTDHLADLRAENNTLRNTIDTLVNLLEDMEIAAIVKDRLADPRESESLEELARKVGLDPADFATDAGVE